MQIDQQLVFSDGQALTATAVSTNVLDMGVARDLGAGEPLFLLVSVGAVVSNATWNAAFKGADDAAISSNVVTKFTTPTITPVAGMLLAFRIDPGIQKRYYRLDYTLAGGTTPSITVTAALVKDVQIKPYSRPSVL